MGMCSWIFYFVAESVKDEPCAVFITGGVFMYAYFESGREEHGHGLKDFLRPFEEGASSPTCNVQV